MPQKRKSMKNVQIILNYNIKNKEKSKKFHSLPRNIVEPNLLKIDFNLPYLTDNKTRMWLRTNGIHFSHDSISRNLINITFPVLHTWVHTV